MLPFVIPAAVSGISALFGHLFGGGHKSQPAPQTTPMSATVQSLLPSLLPLIQRSGNYADQSYQLGLQRYLQADPLRQSLLGMSQSLLPRMYQTPIQGFSLPPQLQQPSAPPSSDSFAVPRRRMT